jgi:predicted metalloendopeptidase
MAFETEIAKIHWDQAAERDVPRTNNPMSSAQLAAYAPGLDWKAWFERQGAPQQRMIVRPTPRSRRWRRSMPKRRWPRSAVAGLPCRRAGLALSQQGDGRQPL